MKKVRFESPLKQSHNNMENDCRSPRPFASVTAPPINNYVMDNHDAIKRFELSNACPYPMLKKSDVLAMKDRRISDVTPSSELDLSILDASNQEPRNWFGKTHVNVPVIDAHQDVEIMEEPLETKVLEPREVPNQVTNNVHDTNKTSKNDYFFLKKNELDMFQHTILPTSNHNTTNFVNKENSPINLNKTELPEIDTRCAKSQTGYRKRLPNFTDNDEQCCPCIQYTNNCRFKQVCCPVPLQDKNVRIECSCQVVQHTIPHKHNRPSINKQHSCIPCDNSNVENKDTSATPIVNKKNWKLQRYENNKNSHCMELETFKDSDEPTVADLYKIIQAQNEQLKILQEKVDNFITNKNTVENKIPALPVKNAVTDVQSIDNDNHKISIGVMTSFEMIRSSTVFNKEVISKSNTQVQCNQSYINITGVTTRPDVPNRILDGITPHLEKPKSTAVFEKRTIPNESLDCRVMKEMSLHDIHIDAITPMLSPEQSMYLDIKDYSSSTSSSEDQSNAGWTYYNKVMTHVNGMLQDSDLPSSASALYRNTRQHCVQMQVDKTDISISKRVTFDNDPLGFHRKLINPAVLTDTSMKMNQLAMKYLKVAPAPVMRPVLQPLALPTDMSIATRNYMEKHQLIQGHQRADNPTELPRFLDITALKRQPKLL